MDGQRHRSGRKNYGTLLQILPKVGFEWRTVFTHKRLLSNRECKQITQHMKSLLPKYDKVQVEQAIVKMFDAATATIDGQITCSNVEFWGQVKPKVVWLRGMSGEDILKFSWKVLSARAVAEDIHSFEMEKRDMTIDELPMEVTEATKAVDAFRDKLESTQTPAVQKEIHPSWIRSEFNAGDEESTKAAFLQAIENHKNGLTLSGRPKGGPATEGNRDEEEYNEEDYGEDEYYEEEYDEYYDEEYAEDNEYYGEEGAEASFAADESGDIEMEDAY